MQQINYLLFSSLTLNSWCSSLFVDFMFNNNNNERLANKVTVAISECDYAQNNNFSFCNEIFSMYIIVSFFLFHILTQHTESNTIVSTKICLLIKWLEMKILCRCLLSYATQCLRFNGIEGLFRVNRLSFVLVSGIKMSFAWKPYYNNLYLFFFVSLLKETAWFERLRREKKHNHFARFTPWKLSLLMWRQFEFCGISNAHAWMNNKNDQRFSLLPPLLLSTNWTDTCSQPSDKLRE